MDYNKIIKEIGRGKHHARDLDRETAYTLYHAMLAGDVPELGALLIAMRIKAEAPEELLGFYQAMQEQVMALQVPASLPPPIVIPSYNGAHMQLDLLVRQGKYENGFMHGGPVPPFLAQGTWVPARINFTSLARPDQFGSGAALPPYSMKGDMPPISPISARMLPSWASTAVHGQPWLSRICCHRSLPAPIKATSGANGGGTDPTFLYAA